jgi:hypothetical protein
VFPADETSDLVGYASDHFFKGVERTHLANGSLDDVEVVGRSCDGAGIASVALGPDDSLCGCRLQLSMLG